MQLTRYSASSRIWKRNTQFKNVKDEIDIISISLCRYRIICCLPLNRYGKERKFKILNGTNTVFEKTADLNAEFKQISYQGNPSILYPNIFQNIDSRYKRLTDGFKQEYIIKNASVINYSFTEISKKKKSLGYWCI